MSKKMSYVATLDAILNGEPCEGEIRERVIALREAQAKRSTYKSNKPTKAQVANAEIGEAIVSAMTAGEVYTIADIKGLVPALSEATPQKVGPICRKLTENGRLVEGKVKGKVTYTLA